MNNGYFFNTFYSNLANLANFPGGLRETRLAQIRDNLEYMFLLRSCSETPHHPFFTDESVYLFCVLFRPPQDYTFGRV